jgi:hypothetical protein
LAVLDFARVEANFESRKELGSEVDTWIRHSYVLSMALPVIEVLSCITDEEGVPLHAEEDLKVATLIGRNYVKLTKDLDFVKAIISISRNLISIGEPAWSQCAETLYDKKILQIIDICVRVTGRGFDGGAKSVAEQMWRNITKQCEHHELPLCITKC